MNHQVSRIMAASDEQAASLVRPATLADLAERIMSDPLPGASRVPACSVTRRSSRSRRRLLIAIPVAIGLTAVVLGAMSLAAPGQKVGPVVVGPPGARAAVLSFTRQGRYIDVVVRKALGSPERYESELAAHHLRITVLTVAASPSVVGTVVYEGDNGHSGITLIRSKRKCYTPGGGWQGCAIGIRVPAGFRGVAEVAFGRAARPGERYQTTGSVTAPGEAMHGLRFSGKTVAAVLSMLGQRDVTVAAYTTPDGTHAHHVPAWWHVYFADPWAPHQVMLLVGPSRLPPPVQTSPPLHCRAHQPCPSPGPSAPPR